MGKNYFVQSKVQCDNCGSKHTCREGIHIGKSSAGWKFTFAWNDGEYYKSLDEMKEWTKGKTIWDEYGTQVSYDEFWDLVESKRDDLMDHITYKHNHGSHEEYGIVVDGIYFMYGYFS